MDRKFFLKVCGNNSCGQVRALQEMEIDYAGLIFYPQSPRVFKDEKHATKIKALTIQKVGVYVNAELEQIEKDIEMYGLNIVQLHGDETPVYCQHISDLIPVIKAFRITYGVNGLQSQLEEYVESCDYFLFDKNAHGLYGGTGEKFNWDLLKNIFTGVPFFLSGGIDLSDADLIKEFEHPDFYGIDINSKFELSPGVKDLNKIQKFVNLLK